MKKYIIAVITTVSLGGIMVVAKNQVDKKSDCCKPNAECCVKAAKCCQK